MIESLVCILINILIRLPNNSTYAKIICQTHWRVSQSDGQIRTIVP